MAAAPAGATASAFGRPSTARAAKAATAPQRLGWGPTNASRNATVKVLGQPPTKQGLEATTVFG